MIGYVRKASFFFVLCLLLTSCNNNKEQATARFEQAKRFAQEMEYNAARLQLDSIKLLYPHEISVLKESQLLTWEIEKKELERSLAYLDSLLTFSSKEAELLKEKLLFEKNEVYQTIGIYMNKNQTLEKTQGISYLRFYVNEKGVMTMMAVASGHGKGTFSSVRAETSTGIYAETPVISKSDSNNFTGEVSQTLTFTKGKDNEFIEFLYLYKNKPLKILYLGGSKAYSFSFSKADVNALQEIYDLSNALSVINQSINEMKLIQAKLSFVNQAIEKSKANINASP